MAETLVMLALSPTMETGTITSWHKRRGRSSVSVICFVR